jgi:hypothetical protein
MRRTWLRPLRLQSLTRPSNSAARPALYAVITNVIVIETCYGMEHSKTREARRFSSLWTTIEKLLKELLVTKQ